MEHSEKIKHFIDWASISVTVATIFSWLPNIAALATFVWTVIRIYETKTVQKLLGKFRK